MLNHIPDSIELVDYIEDGEQARHYRFRLLNYTKLQDNSHPHQWQQAQPGQFFMLNVPSVGEAPFTFTEPPNEQGEFRAFIRKMGQLTSALFNHQPKDILGARGPFGRGWPLDKVINTNTLIIAGGCGLAPLVTLINQLSNNLTNQQELVLVYGSRDKANQLLTPERIRWQKQFTIFNTLDEIDVEDKHSPININALGNKPQNLPITVQGSPLSALSYALKSFTTPATTALLCGPEEMMNSVASALNSHGMASDSIFLALERRMHCAVGLCGHCYMNNQYVCKNGPTFSWKEITKINGYKHLPTNKKNS
jgi:anaerobic sulfite reductase subunit B